MSNTLQTQPQLQTWEAYVDSLTRPKPIDGLGVVLENANGFLAARALTEFQPLIVKENVDAVGSRANASLAAAEAAILRDKIANFPRQILCRKRAKKGSGLFLSHSHIN